MTATPALPVVAVLPELLASLAAPGGAAVVVAEPGAGKTTLVPDALLDAPWRTGRVIVVEPRRLAARAAGSRLAAMRGEPIGRTVGWRMRDDTRVSAQTMLEVVTDGVFTRMVQTDPSLEGIDAVVFDEIHERSLDADVGLALCLDVRDALRPDLRIVAMSATVDAAVVATLIATDTVVTAPGRTYPVDTIWLGPSTPTFDARAVADACGTALRESAGDILVFLPGIGEIRATERSLRDRLRGAAVDVLPLHGMLTAGEQDRALSTAAPGRRKVVLATSIAETSLTIDGIGAVVDSGWSRRARFSPRRGMGGLVTTRVSQASADQRRGRAGRTAAGRCYRLWSEAEHARLAPYDEPEILAADHAPLALELVRWGDPDGTTLRWQDAPPIAALRAARALLLDLGLVDEHDRLTDHGRDAVELPLHPRLAHALLRANQLGHGRVACDVVALLGERDTGRHLGTVDLDERVRRISGPAARRAERLARSIRAKGRTDAVGLVVALAYPDRIALRRGNSARYLLASGSGAELDPHDPLVRNEWIAVAELDLRPGGSDARVLLAAALDAEDLRMAAGERLSVAEVVAWDRQSHDVRAEAQQRLGAIVVSARPVAAPAAATDALLAGIRVEGLGLLPRWEQTQAFRSRVAFCRSAFGDAWPDLSEPALLATIDNWLAPWLGGARRRADLDRVDVASALRAQVPPELIGRIDSIAPTHVVLPNGQRRALDYTSGQPVLALRLQAAFGWNDTPRVAEGRVPVVLHLLSPANRPVQITRDLAGFWRGSYAQVRGEMRGRYPKHSWPVDPTAP